MNYITYIKKVQQKGFLPSGETFRKADSGTKHTVFISDDFVIRLREHDKEILARESDFLTKINHPLIPKVLSSGELDGIPYMIENRLPGVTIEDTWGNLPDEEQRALIEDFVGFLNYLRSQNFAFCYSVTTGKKYGNFYELLTDGLESKLRTIRNFETAIGLLKSLHADIMEGRDSFSSSPKALVHGDLIFHNLLTRNGRLSGVLDWELALIGDPDYDIFRLMNFQRSAKLYLDRGDDRNFEHGYLTELLNMIRATKIVDFNNPDFIAKYRVCRAIYYTDALCWAVNSDSPNKNIQEVIAECNLK